MNKKIRIIIFGGSGHWSEQNHYPAIVSLKDGNFPVEVAAICDPVNPYTVRKDDYSEGRSFLAKILEEDGPIWIDPTDSQFLNEQLMSLSEDIDVAIIATNPTLHFKYSLWAVKAGIHVLCDKPIIVENDSAWSIEDAKKISTNFTALLDEVRQKRTQQPLHFAIPLRRRFLPAFKNIALELGELYAKRKQGLTHLNLVLNGGLHRYPEEFMRGGAHGYLDGVGSLAHSTYHYLDFITWLISTAPGRAQYVGVSVQNVKRVSDYLLNEGFLSLADVNGHAPKRQVEGLTPSITNSELDFQLSLALYDSNKRRIGQAYFTVNHTTFSPRTADVTNVLDHANRAGGGRMSQLMLDVHQGALQNWQLIKNDVVFEEDNITVHRRIHPSLSRQTLIKTDYEDAYRSDDLNPKQQVAAFLTCIANGNQKVDGFAQDIEEQVFTMDIFAAAYHALAAEYRGAGQEIMVGIQ